MHPRRMTPLPDKLLLVVGVTTLCMLSPGPDMVLVMRNTLTRDRRAGALTALGVLTGNMFHIGYCTLGIGWLLSRSATAYDVLRYGGALYLVYLGIQGLRSQGGGLAQVESGASGPATSAYAQGVINNLLNPKGSLFYLGVFTQLITPDTSLAESLLLIAAMVSVSTLFWVVFVQTLHLPAIRTRLARWHRTLDRTFGLVLILLGAKIALAP